MKKLFLSALLLTLTVFVQSQTVITSFKNQILGKIDGEFVIKSTNYEPIEMSVYNNTLVVRDRANSVYRITSDEPVVKRDKTGEYKFYNAKDESLTGCSIVIMKPYNTDLRDPFVAVMYDNFWYVYFIKTQD